MADLPRGVTILKKDRIPNLGVGRDDNASSSSFLLRTTTATENGKDSAADPVQNSV